MNAFSKRLLPIAAALWLAGCATQRSVVVEPAGDYAAPVRAPAAPAPAHPQVPGGSYQVVKGDTLYSIAFRNKVDFRDLAGWNNIAVPYTIWPGQVLRLSPPGGMRNPAVAVAPAPSAPAQPASPATPPHAAPSSPGAPMFESVAAPTAASSSAAPAPAAVKPAATASTIVPVAGQPTPTRPAPPATTPIIPLKPAPVPATVAVPPTPTASPVAAPEPTAPAAVGGTRSSGGVTWRWPADGSLIKRFQSGDAIPGIEIAGKAGDPIRAAADGVVVYSGNGLVGYGELIIIKHNDSLLSAYGHNRKRMVTEGQKVTAGQQIAEMGSTSAPRDELQFQIRRDGNPVDPLGYLPAH